MRFGRCCQVRRFLLYCGGIFHSSTLPLNWLKKCIEKASLVVFYVTLREALLQGQVLDEDLALIGDRYDARLARVNCKG